MASTFDRACAQIGLALSGDFRREIVADASDSKDLRTALLRLRAGMRVHAWRARAARLDLTDVVRALDARTRRDGFHVLNDWDGKADAVNPDVIPVDVLHYLANARGAERADPNGLAIILDYYFVYLLALLSMRIWDDGGADENLDRVDRLLEDLQGPNGSGQRFARNAGTLMLLATSHFEMADHGYAALLERVRTLGPRHRRDLALVHASALGGHLRFGFETTYGRDTVATRDDNPADYPWLCFALATLMREYSRLHERRPLEEDRAAVAEAILQGLSPDAGAFVADRPPSSLAALEDERAAFRELFRAHRHDLIEDFERCRPSDRAYSPMSFFFNFSQNVVKGTVVDALLWGEPWNLTLNDLLTAIPREEPASSAKERLARSLMAYARSSPDTIRGRATPVLVYDPASGRAAFAAAMRQIRQIGG